MLWQNDIIKNKQIKKLKFPLLTGEKVENIYVLVKSENRCESTIINRSMNIKHQSESS